MRLVQALRVNRGDVISFVGAGGKTSALFRLARELAAEGWRVVGTTTTRVAAAEVQDAPAALTVSDPIDFDAVREALDAHGFVFIYDQLRRDKALGLDSALLRQFVDRVNSDVLLIEADGSRRLPLKAPYAHEPVITTETTRVVVVAGMDIIGQPLDDEHVYNPEAMMRRYGYPAGGEIVWPWVASVLRDEQLGLRHVDPAVPVTILLNKTEREDVVMRRRARLIAGLLLRSSRIDSVAIGAMQDAEDPVFEMRCPVGAVVLAAGLSSRMGRSKVLLPWGQQTVLEAILRRLFMARLEDIVIVTGHEAASVEALAARLEVRTAHNPAYRSGEMLSSLQTGLQALQDRVQACLVVLGDQPQLQGRVIAEVLAAYAVGQGDIVAPSYRRRRGHPILIDRRYWHELLALPAGQSPRDVINAHADEIAYVNVPNDSILADIDTPEQYQDALRRAGLA
ncbi:MAG: putative selenium-dependent hydroxylase accessory protein YqeC [Anaerolineae bacterium]|nr:putative selenium-dependent hydroxylase accessory protein YqeC [Anaerolineae bacterium]